MLLGLEMKRRFNPWRCGGFDNGNMIMRMGVVVVGNGKGFVVIKVVVVFGVWRER